MLAALIKTSVATMIFPPADHRNPSFPEAAAAGLENVAPDHNEREPERRYLEQKQRWLKLPASC
jgi:hypothetical protein